jgi:S-formylglutathione hydrolase FrmB
MRCLVAAILLLASVVVPARAQVFEHVKLDHLNGKLQGKVIDFTQNHGTDRRIYSPILGRPRDLYVYLPPGYDPSQAYPLIVFLHGADIDEHAFLDPTVLKALDFMISRGEIPPVVIAAPDGTYEGENRINSTHSLWVNGRGGRFADHIVDEVLPFVLRTYSIRPEREAHATLGISAGGFGAMSTAMKHRELFGAVATIAGPINMRYDNIQGRYSDDFDPATYREETEYDPDLVIARYYFGLLRRRVKQFLEPVYGEGPDMIARIARDNPADLLFSTGLQPGELAMYVNYPGRDNYNFDAHAQSFAWLAAQRGIAVELAENPTGRHNLSYIERAELPAYLWLGRHILPPIKR